ncbi:hypothetical protein GCM10009792_10190 [Microcella alkalica]|uniref:Putative membrane protein YdbT with pleckstrin-like domain n=1 Tax=Microcella alkalica TaxID=355930 RepID=A0A839ECU2_9MICO|nr:PH domain-containing protein [Microcella alkalica]MBA8848923.1 putative membrane protein YdbT with pleckstrin-like domain [Microcella alkalica]
MTGEPREPERVIVLLRAHARCLVVPVLVVTAVSGAAVYGAAVLEETWLRIAVAAGGALAIILLGLVPYVRWLASHVLITTRRIVVRRGLGVRMRQEVLHSRSYDVSLRQSGLQRLFGSGDILLNTGLDRPVVLRDLPRAALVQEALSDLMQQSRSAVAEARRQTGATPLAD